MAIGKCVYRSMDHRSSILRNEINFEGHTLFMMLHDVKKITTRDGNLNKSYDMIQGSNNLN